MKLVSLRPARRFIIASVALMLMSLLYPLLGSVWHGATLYEWLPFSLLFMLFTASGFDLFRSRLSPKLGASRTLIDILSVHQATKVDLALHNESAAPLSFEFREKLPPDWEHNMDAQLVVSLKAGETQHFKYEVTARERGPKTIDGIYFRVASGLGLWEYTWFYTCPSEHKVYPNFSGLADLSGLNGSVNLREAGLKKFNLRGSGMDFLQLRDYREGESLRQIDWRASSRFKRLISKEFQEEKNQHVVLMVDAGRRMRVQDDELSYFDRSLHALTMLSFTALKNGDRISIQSFGGETRWLNHVRGAKSVSQVMHHFYDLYPQKVASDYLSAAQDLISKHSKRALVMLVTCLRDEDFEDIFLATTLLQEKHLVVIISIEENIYDEIEHKAVEQLDNALDYASSVLLKRSIHRNIRRLQHQGVVCIQSKAQLLSSDLINSYLSIKKSGAL
ncbi:DUF58 domain-containing protein [Ningiella sp. W23]|uniref:DUF58 domain-containing protein n=1 Tax=Ningiella sp. W23 TaxID=3023715 RepID=UPI003757970A